MDGLVGVLGLPVLLLLTGREREDGEEVGLFWVEEEAV